jgi:hypothetical protein
MEKLKLNLSFVLAFLFLLCLPLCVSADEVPSASLNSDTYKAGDVVKLTVSVPESKNIAAFVTEIYFYSEKLSYQKTANLSSCYIKSNESGGSVSVVATAKESHFTGEVFSVNFKLLDDTSSTDIDLAFRQLADENGNDAMQDTSYTCTVIPSEKASSECQLLSLTPSEGKLNEEFSSEVYSYTMNVPYSVKSLSFDCEVSEGASYKVNRKNLGAGGSVTDFTITVTAPNGNKQSYTVSVTRGEYSNSNGNSDTNGDNNNNSENSTSGEEAKLLSITPSEGSLNEEFSSDVYSYTMSVPYSVKSLSFDCEVSEGATYKVNRKNLGSGGSTTDFKITVTSESGNEKNEYIISVTRGEYVKSSGTSKTKTSSSTETPLILSLTPSAGSLNEEFSPYTNNYTMTLPYDVKNLEFDVQTSDGATWKINRKTLGKGGSTVDFKITVKSSDGKSKNVYVISVTREEKDGTSKKSKSSDETSKEYVEPEILSEYNADSRLTIAGDSFPTFIIIVMLGAMLVVLVVITIKIFKKK